MALEFLWDLEEKFWTGDKEFHASHLAGEAYMVLPSPVGILDRNRTLESLDGVDRWRDVGMSERHLVELADDAAALVYSVTAKKENDARPYHALCSSAYVRKGEEWLLALHQQTPLN